MYTKLSLKKINPKAYEALVSVENSSNSKKLSKELQLLIKIRASQLNNCFYCIDTYTRQARQIGEIERRIYALSTWREAPFYTGAERAVLALTDAITLVKKGLPDEIYSEVRKYFNETETANIIMAIISINSWNRYAIATGQMPNK